MSKPIEGPFPLAKLGPFEVRWWIEEDDLSVHGNAAASGDAMADRHAENEIIERLNASDPWAWFTLVVEARCGAAVGRATLGACSYRDREDLEGEGADGYIATLAVEACREARAEFERLKRAIEDTEMLLGGAR